MLRLRILLAFLWMIIFPYPAFSVSSGYLGSGGITNVFQSEDTGFRQNIELRSSGGLLVGRPQESPIALISIHAPDISTGHVLLREIRHSPSEVSLLLISPISLESAIHRATIFIKKSKPGLTLWERVNDEWSELAPMSIQVAENRFGATGQQTEILAFTVNKLGLYFLSETDFVSPRRLPPPSLNPGPSALLGGDIFRGLLPGLTALLAVIAGVLVSVWRHRLEK